MTKSLGQQHYERSPEGPLQAPWKSLPGWHRRELEAIAARRADDDALIERCALAVENWELRSYSEEPLLRSVADVVRALKGKA